MIGMLVICLFAAHLVTSSRCEIPSSLQTALALLKAVIYPYRSQISTSAFTASIIIKSLECFEKDCPITVNALLAEITAAPGLTLDEQVEIVDLIIDSPASLFYGLLTGLVMSDNINRNILQENCLASYSGTIRKRFPQGLSSVEEQEFSTAVITLKGVNQRHTCISSLISLWQFAISENGEARCAMIRSMLNQPRHLVFYITDSPKVQLRLDINVKINRTIRKFTLRGILARKTDRGDEPLLHDYIYLDAPAICSGTGPDAVASQLINGTSTEYDSWMVLYVCNSF